eukprot:COSAG01_NODE_49655_length_370_cov_0.933579_1_plen_45_part_10
MYALLATMLGVEYSLAAALSSLTSQSQLGGASESDDDAAADADAE